jgi:hypothetical protein
MSHLTHTTLLAVGLALTLTACPDDPKRSDDTHDSDATDTSDSVDVPDMTDTPDSADTSDTADTLDTSDTRDVPDIAPGVWPWPEATITVAPSKSWSETIAYPDDDFLSAQLAFDRPMPRWIKFVVFTGDPTRVYFQDTTALPTHLEFASTLPPFDGFTQSELDQVTLDNSLEKQAILGAVIYSPRPWTGVPGPLALREVGVQLVGHDPYTFHIARTVLDLVASKLTSSDGGATPDVFYFPTPHQAEVARADADLFDAVGHPVATAHRWDPNATCYTTGWAVGRLVHVPSDAVESAFRDGTLKHDDLLVTDRAPDVLPPVAGLIVRTPSSATSAAGILSKTRATPFILFANAHEHATLDALDGHLVALRAASNWESTCSVSLIDLEDHLTPGALDAVLSLKERTAPIVAASTGTLVVNASTLTRANRSTHGGLAVNLGLLARALPAETPTALAVSFGLFDNHLTALRTTIDARLASHTWPFDDVDALLDDLAFVRDLVVTTPLAAAELTAISTALQTAGLDTAVLRVRPSTNFTDLDTFAGEGLHAEHLGCLADTTSGSSPSVCSANHPAQSLATAIRLALAELWSFESFAYRRKHDMSDNAVKVGLVLQQTRSTHDIEGRIEAFDANQNLRHVLTTQRAPWLSSPDAQTEVATANIYSFGTFMTPMAMSDLGELGVFLMKWEDEYTAVSALVETVQAAWAAQFTPRPVELATSLAFARTPDGVIVDHLSPVPPPTQDPDVTPYLLPGAPVTLCTFQGESGAILGNHRLKSRVTLTHTSGPLDDDSVDLANTGFEGDPTTFAGYFHTPPTIDQWGTASPIIDGWTTGANASLITWQLDAALPLRRLPTEVPLVVLTDGWLALSATYANPVPEPGQWPDGTSTFDYTALVLCPEETVLTPSHIPVHRHATADGMTVDVRFWWPPAPTGATAGYTAPLVKWDVTTITGLTSTPIELRGYWSQTYRPGHHNFSEDFVFEPRLEEGIDPTLITELNQQDIAALLVTYGFESLIVDAIGLNGKIRRIVGGVDR